MSLLLDTHGFAAMLQDLARISGRDFQHVLLDQAGAVLDICIQRSPGPKTSISATLKKKVEFRVQKPGRYIGDSGTLVNVAGDKRCPRPVPTGTLQTLTGTRGGKRGREWYIGENRSGKRIYLTEKHMLGNEKWHRRQGIKFAIYTSLNEPTENAVAAIGTLKASWLQIADKIGAPLRKAPGYLKQVRMNRDDGAGSRMVLSDLGAFVELVQSNSFLIERYNGAQILQGAIDTRQKAFQHEMRTGVFKDVAYRAKRYPGIFVTTNS